MIDSKEERIKDEDIRTSSFDEILPHYNNMIWSLSHKFHKNNTTQYIVEEIYQFGLEGLWRATETYNPSKSKFTTHAYLSIVGHIKNGLSQEKEQRLSISRADVDLKERVAKIVIDTENAENKRWDEAIKENGLTMEEWKVGTVFNKKPVSLFKPVVTGAGEEIARLLDTLPGDNGIEEKIVGKINLKEVISSLSDIEQEMVRLVYEQGFNKSEASEILNIPTSTFGRWEKKIFNKLKTKVDTIY